MQACKRGVSVGLANERHFAGEALVQHESETVEIGSSVERLAADLLWREVLGRTHHDVVVRQVIFATRVESFGDTEVSEKHVSALRDQDVSRLHIPVDDVLVVRFFQRCRDRHADMYGQLWSERSLTIEHITKALAFDVLHDYGLLPVVLQAVIDSDDVGVVDAGTRDGFAAETFHQLGVASHVGLQDLDGDFAVELDVAGQPDFSHAALGDVAVEAIAIADQLTEHLSLRHRRDATLVLELVRSE